MVVAQVQVAALPVVGEMTIGRPLTRDFLSGGAQPKRQNITDRISACDAHPLIAIQNGDVRIRGSERT